MQISVSSGETCSLTLRIEAPPSLPGFRRFSASHHRPSWNNKKTSSASFNIFIFFLCLGSLMEELTLVPPPAEWPGTPNWGQSLPSSQYQPGSLSAGSPWWCTAVLQQHGGDMKLFSILEHFRALVTWKSLTHSSFLNSAGSPSGCCRLMLSSLGRCQSELLAVKKDKHL